MRAARVVLIVGLIALNPALAAAVVQPTDTAHASHTPWQYYHRPESDQAKSPAAGTQPAPHRPIGQGHPLPHAEHRFGFPTHSDPLFDRNVKPDYVRHYIERPAYDRPRYDPPNVDKPKYHIEPYRKPQYKQPLMIMPNDNKPHYTKQYILPPSLKKPSYQMPTYNDRPNYVIKPAVKPAYDHPDYDNPDIRYRRPSYRPPVYNPQEYKPPRYEPPPYIAPPK